METVYDIITSQRGKKMSLLITNLVNLGETKQNAHIQITLFKYFFG